VQKETSHEIDNLLADGVDATDKSDNLSLDLKIHARYFALNLYDLKELDFIKTESFLTTSKETSEKILDALKHSDVILLIASTKSECFIGYAAVLKEKTVLNNAQKTFEKKNKDNFGLPISWTKLCTLPFKDISEIMNSFNDERPVSEFFDAQVNNFYVFLSAHEFKFFLFCSIYYHVILTCNLKRIRSCILTS
jgi:hypothetical protein